MATAAERKRTQRERAKRGLVTTESLDKEIAKQFRAILLSKPKTRTELAPYFRLAEKIIAAFPKDRERATKYLYPDMEAADRNPAAPRHHQAVTRHESSERRPKRPKQQTARS